MHLFGDFVVYFNDLIIRVFPNGVSTHVSSPEQNVGLDVVSDEFEHLSKSGRSSIASVISPRTSSIFRVSRVTVLLSTAKRGIAVGISAFLVIEINMNV